MRVVSSKLAAMQFTSRSSGIGFGAALFLDFLIGQALASDPPRQDTLTSPGPEHGFLEDLAGSYQLSSEVTLSPGDLPVRSAGSSDSKVILGGRYLLSRAKLGSGAGAYEQLTLLGYDRTAGHYVNISLDTASTSIGYLTGNRDEHGALRLENPTGSVSVSMALDEQGTLDSRIEDPAGGEGGTFVLSRTVARTSERK